MGLWFFTHLVGIIARLGNDQSFMLTLFQINKLLKRRKTHAFQHLSPAQYARCIWTNGQAILATLIGAKFERHKVGEIDSNRHLI